MIDLILSPKQKSKQVILVKQSQKGNVVVDRLGIHVTTIKHNNNLDSNLYYMLKISDLNNIQPPLLLHQATPSSI